MYLEDRKLEEIEAQEIKLSDAEKLTAARIAAAKRRVRELEGELRQATQKFAIGELPEAALTELQRSLRQARGAAEDAMEVAQLAAEQFEQVRKQLRADQTKWSRRRGQRQGYVELRDKLVSDPLLANDGPYCENLREVCRHFDDSSDDADAAIAAAKRKAA